MLAGDSGRRALAQGLRHPAWSDDQGERLSGWQVEQTLPDPMCRAGLTQVKTAAGQALLFTNPPHVCGDGRYTPELRRELTVRVSLDDGRSWPHGRQLEPELSAYSSLAATGADRVHCLYEAGSETCYDRIRLATFDLAWATA